MGWARVPGDRINAKWFFSFLAGLAAPQGRGLAEYTLYNLNIRDGRYLYMNTLHQLSQPTTPHPRITWPPCPSPVNISALEQSLSTHTDQQFAHYILQGVSQGFRIGFHAPSLHLRSSTRNHPSSLVNQQVVSAYIEEEVAMGRMVGPIPPQLHPSLHTSPIGLVPKGRDSGQFRMIVDLSAPDGHSTNDGISTDLCSLQYASIDNALHYIVSLGRHTQLAKVDLKNAYRMLPIHPDDRHLLAISWQNKVYVDQALPFGLRSAPKIFTAFADAIGWALCQAGMPLHIHYLDDFLFFSPPASSLPLAQALHKLQELGVPVATHKIEGPATQIVFLGIIVDTSKFELRLPLAKLQHLQSILETWSTRRSGPRREFESLLGHLAHAATVVRQGRTFLRQSFTVLARARRHYHHVHLDGIVRADLLWWKYFLQSWNGTMFFQPLSVPRVHVHSDASGSFGCGALLSQSHWFQLSWPRSWDAVDITTKELLPIVLAAAIWGREWHGQAVCFHTDNMGVVAILQKRSANNAMALHLLRCLYFYAAFYRFEYVSQHIPGVVNVAADAISRNNLTLFFSLFPQATRVSIPKPLEDLLVIQQPDWGSSPWTSLFGHTLPAL